MPRCFRRHRVTVIGNVALVVLLTLAGSAVLLRTQLLKQLPKGSEEASKKVGEETQDEEDFFLFTHKPQDFIDWHNYTLIALEEKRRGPGEQGTAVFTKQSEHRAVDQLYRVNGYNAYVSDKISLHRSLRDLRNPKCKTEKYRRQLPSVSVVIPFHEEHWSTLVRTFVSALRRAPSKLVKEVILVDDFSTKTQLKEPLERFVDRHYKNKVRILRNEKREGLIRTRIRGAENATGDVLIFLDSHCEAGINWLPPLLDPIAEDYRTVVCPLIDILDYDSFEYRPQDNGARGVFDWDLLYKRVPLLPRDLDTPSEPFESPVMAGGLFAISRKWFWELGGYDSGLEIWGGEQYELSFKTWMCGGRMYDAPCSRVGHVYRRFAPFPNNASPQFAERNYRRVAEVWMDEFKEHVFRRRPAMQAVSPGDLTAQLAVRSRLQCKPFSWFMQRVAFDLTQYFPPVLPEPAAKGSLRWMLDTRFCVDANYGERGAPVALTLCREDNPDRRRGEQDLELSFRRDVRVPQRGLCLDVPENRDAAVPILFPCHGFKGNQWWKFDPQYGQLRHVVTNKCLEGDSISRSLAMQICDHTDSSQRWTWTNIRGEVLKQYLAEDERK